MSRKTQIIIEKGKDGTYSAYPAKLKALIIGEGRTAGEAKKDFLASYAEVLAYYKEEGKRVPEELENLSFEYKYDLTAFFNYFDFINVSKFAKSVGIEPSLMRHYKLGGTSISESQKAKIEKGIHSLAKELHQVSL